jgi:hypothetical protein
MHQFVDRQDGREVGLLVSRNLLLGRGHNGAD